MFKWKSKQEKKVISCFGFGFVFVSLFVFFNAKWWVSDALAISFPFLKGMP